MRRNVTIPREQIGKWISAIESFFSYEDDQILETCVRQMKFLLNASNVGDEIYHEY